MLTNMKRNVYYLKFIAGLLLFGSNGIVAGQIEMASHSIVLFRTGIGAALLIALFVIFGNRLPHGLNKRHLLLSILSGFAMGVSWLFLYKGFQTAGVGMSTILYYCGPVIVVALSPVLFGENLTKKKIICFAAILIGMLLTNIDQIGSSSSLTGITCGGMSAVMFSLMLITNKKAYTITGTFNSMVQLSCAFIATAVYSLFVSNVSLPTSAGDYMWLFVLGTLNTALGLYLYFSAIDKLSVQSVSALGYIEPLSAILLSMVILGESLVAIQILGGSLILISAFVMEARPAIKLRRFFLMRLHRAALPALTRKGPGH